MSELTAQEINVFDGTNWVSDFSIYDGNNFQNVNDGKVNVRGEDGNWYKKNSIVASLSPTTNGFTSGKYHLDMNNSNWATLRTQSNCNYNTAFRAMSDKNGSYYYIQRGIIRFDFSAINPFTFNSASLNLYIDTQLSENFYEEMSLYLFNNDSTPTKTDFSNFGARYSEIAGCTFTADTMEISFNSAGITALQNAINNQSIITFMLRTKADSEDITPTITRDLLNILYPNSELIFN